MEEREDENVSSKNPNPWNKREQKSPLLLYLLIALLCLVLAYALSGTAK